MTTFSQDAIDFDVAERDAEYAARKRSTAEDWQADTDMLAFEAACRRVAVEGRISQNDLRLHLLEDTIDGPRCSIPHNRYSALFSRAVADGFLVKDGHDVCTTSPTGNNGKFQRTYRLVRHP